MIFRPSLLISLLACILPVTTFAQKAGQAAQPGSATLAIPATVSATNSPTPLSQRVVHYEIDAKYDPSTHKLEGSETLTYHNLTGQPLDTFPFHLYLNAFQPKATWIHESKRDGTRDTAFDKWEDKDYGSDEITNFEVVGEGDLTSQLQYIQPDDNNKDDKTVIQIKLPKPIPADGYVQFKIKFHDQFPETLERTGYKRDFLLAGQWFPKVGVWIRGGWNCHQFHGTTEFFADFGVYDVNITVPQNEVVGASGVRVNDTKNSDGTETYAYHGEDIHDFAWTASPRYMIKDDVYQGTMGPVALHIMMQPGHWSQAQRHDDILKNTLTRFEKWYGPYPYKTLTLVDPEPGSAAEGMEYPTFITGGTNWWMPNGLYLPELVVEHEFGHQYWYGMVATNEFEDAWMDEGINSYTEVKVLDDILGQDRSAIHLLRMKLSEHEVQRLSYAGVADLDPITRKGWQFANNNSYGGITYGKTATTLVTLESIIGEDTMQKAMHAYFMKYRFTHPVAEDFLKTIEEVSGKDLRWYFNQAVYGTNLMDYEVMQVDSSPVDWWKKDFKEGKNPGDTEYESTVIVHRKGDFQMPIDVAVKFDNGDVVREHWDGQDRWIRYTYDKKAKIVSAEVDPEHKNWLDRNFFNNSKTLEPDSKAALKLNNFWMFVTQLFGQILAGWLI